MIEYMVYSYSKKLALHFVTAHCIDCKVNK